MKCGWAVFLILFYQVASAQQNSTNLNQAAVSQGIASPAMSHTSLFSNGFTFENPMAVSYQNGYHLTGALDGTDSTSFGTEFGVGDTQYGFAIGAYSNACEDGQSEGCDTFVRGTLGAIWGGFAIGFGVQEDFYTVGMMLYPNGRHRLGLIAEFEDPDGITNRRSAFGLGYAFVLPQFTFALDISNRNMENPLEPDRALLVSPGIVIRVDIFSVSLSYDYFANDEDDDFADRTWVGVSARPWSNLEFTFYGEYIDRWTFMTTWFF